MQLPVSGHCRQQVVGRLPPNRFCAPAIGSAAQDVVYHPLSATSEYAPEGTVRNVIQFGETVDGFDIRVVNEREVRAAAGLLFLATFLSLMFILFKQEFTVIKYVITVFLADFLVRVFVNPKYAPTLILARLIVRNQVPEYVGAVQKQFAWLIGIALSGAMFIHMVLMNAFSPITGIICLVCLIFLFFESAFGICLGCMVYPWIYKEKAQYCPGEVCDVHAKQDIQRTSLVQVLVLIAFIAGMILLTQTVHQEYSKTPYDLFGITGKAHVKP
jgi:hypothetical protein